MKPQHFVELWPINAGNSYVYWVRILTDGSLQVIIEKSDQITTQNGS